MITTTINMRQGTYEAVSLLAARLNTTRRSIIIRLLMRIMRDIPVFQGGFTTVAYQPDDPGGCWHCFSIRFRPDENEFFTDLRKVCKLSVSYLVAIAAARYLKEMMTGQNKNVYKNAFFCNYFISRKMTDDLIKWQIYWGTPENLKTPLLE